MDSAPALQPQDVVSPELEALTQAVNDSFSNGNSELGSSWSNLRGFTSLEDEKIWRLLELILSEGAPESALFSLPDDDTQFALDGMQQVLIILIIE